MIVLVCVDDNNGMLFNYRRQSQDCKLRKYILAMSQGKKLWMNTYSAKQFHLSANLNINIDENCVSEATQGEYCFVEDKALLTY